MLNVCTVCVYVYVLGILVSDFLRCCLTEFYNGKSREIVVL